MNEDNHNYLTTQEAARRLLLSARTLENLRVLGTGPVFRRHGRKVVYAPKDLAAWSDSNAKRSTSEYLPPNAA